MNLAIRDIRRHKTRFLLTCVGLGLLLTVVMAMSGIYRGLIGDATKVVETTPAQIWVVQKDTRGPFAESSRLPEDLEHSIAAVEGVRRASPVSFQYVQIPRGDKAIRLFLIGYKLGGIGGPPGIVAGRTITKKHYEIVGSQIRVCSRRYDPFGTGRLHCGGSYSGNAVALGRPRRVRFVGRRTGH